MRRCLTVGFIIWLAATNREQRREAHASADTPAGPALPRDAPAECAPRRHRLPPGTRKIA